MAPISLRAITRRRLSDSETIRVVRSLDKMDDRSCAIVAGALLENGLERLLVKKMRRLSSEARKGLFEFGPLSTCSSKIRIAYAFECLGPSATKDFEAFNDIRNVFAHSSHILTFQKRGIRDRVDSLAHMAQFRMILEAFPREKDDPFQFTGIRGRFLVYAATYIASLGFCIKGERSSEDFLGR